MAIKSVVYRYLRRFPRGSFPLLPLDFDRKVAARQIKLNDGRKLGEFTLFCLGFRLKAEGPL